MIFSPRCYFYGDIETVGKPSSLDLNIIGSNIPVWLFNKQIVGHGGFNLQLKQAVLKSWKRDSIASFISLSCQHCCILISAISLQWGIQTTKNITRVGNCLDFMIWKDWNIGLRWIYFVRRPTFVVRPFDFAIFARRESHLLKGQQKLPRRHIIQGWHESFTKYILHKHCQRHSGPRILSP